MKKIIVSNYFKIAFTVTLNGFLLFFSIASQAQTAYDPLKVIQPSPTAASLGTYGNFPVTYYTGTVGVSIPIYDIKTNNNELPIAINYFSTGVRVADNAGWVGLGWSLSAGGVITKTVRGGDDLFGAGSSMLGYYQAADLPNKFDVLQNDYYYLTSQEADYLFQYDQGWIDTDPDVFNYNFGKYSGKFCLGKSADGSPVYMDAQNNLKLTYDPINDKWLVIDGLGYKYYFGTTEKAQDYNSSSINTESADDALSGDNYSSTNNITTSWYLDQIVAPSGETIQFTYQKISQTKTLISKSEQEKDYLNTLITQSVNIPNNASKYHQYNASYQVIQDVNLKQISFPQGSITFNTTDRDDIEYMGSVKPQKLSEIVINDNNNNVVKKFEFGYDDFLSSTTNTALQNDYTNSRRLELESVTEIGSDGTSKPPYQFNYYDPTNLPYKISKAIDHWGYYNGQTLNSTLLPTKEIASTGQYWVGANRDADQTDSHLFPGVLSAITYPTGGQTQFTYELNDYTNLTGDDQYTLSPNYVLATTMTGTYTASFDIPTIDTPIVVFSSAFKKPSGVNGYVGNYATVYKDGTTPVAVFTEAGPIQETSDDYSDHQTNTVVLYPGHYTMTINNIPGITMSVQANWNGRSRITQRKGCGLRISSIINYQNGNVVDTKKYLYTRPDGTSSGLLISPMVYDFTMQAYEWDAPGGYLQANPSGEAGYWLFQYLARSSNNNSTPGLNANAGAVSYSKVTELDGPNGENGKTEYYYNNLVDVATSVTIPYLPLVHDPLNGKLSESIVYKADGSALKATGYKYNINDIEYLLGLTKAPVLPILAPNSGPGYNTEAMDVIALLPRLQYYHMPSYWVVNNAQIDTLYNNSPNPVITTTTYNYPNHNTLNLVSTEIIDSKGYTKGSHFTYPQDYLSGTTFVDDMVTANIVSSPIETVKYQVDGSGNKTILGGTIKTYKTGGNGLLDQVKVIETVQPINASTFVYSNGTTGNLTTFSPDAHYTTRLTENSYDTYGNLLNQYETLAPHLSYLWDYLGQYPIAMVTNANQGDIAYTSFEADGTGNWTIGSTQRNTGGGFTGSQSYNLSNGSISKSGLTSGTTYVLSYWTQSTSPLTIVGTITGYPITGATRNGWTYYEHHVTGITSLSISGSGNIDELRLYPVSAQMTTYTYDPLVGMTSSTDAKNQTTYYEYDGLQRLMNIKDQYGNILKHIDYHYQGQ